VGIERRILCDRHGDIITSYCHQRQLQSATRDSPTINSAA
jgi:hypothetical protein